MTGVPPTRVKPLRRSRMGLPRPLSLHGPVCVALCLLAVVQFPSSATTWEVPEEIPTIAEALGVAGPHDTVLVSPGQYDIPVVLEMSQPSITLRSRLPRQAVLIGTDDNELILVRADSCRIEGLLLAHLITENTILIEWGIRGTSIRENWIYGSSFALGIEDQGNGTQVIGNEIEWCRAPFYARFNGGGAFIGNVVHDNAQPIIIHQAYEVCDNSLTRMRAGDDTGGSIHGGGVFVTYTSGPVVVENNHIEDNWTSGPVYDEGWVGEGGGIWITNSQNVRVVNNRILRNQATRGAGVFTHNSIVEIRNNLIWANYDSTNHEENPIRGSGGGLYLENSAGVVANNTVFGNVAAIEGGAAFLTSSQNLTLDGNIFAYNTSNGSGVFLQGLPPLSYACNDVWLNASGDYGGDWEVDPTGSNGNISLDPEFCLPDSGNFELNSSSPCSGLGNNQCGLIGAYGVGCSVQDVSDEVSFSGPSFRLFPNPTEGAVRIELSRAFEGVGLSVVDAQGRRVRNLCQPCLGLRFSWDGKLGNGLPAPAGIYYVVEGQRGWSAQKLVLIR